jgi:transcriptional regulator with XRE-family HTH domain
MVFNGMKLKLIRTERRVTTAELAQACGVTAQAVSAWESGKAKEPGSLLTLSCVAKHLGVQITDLCDDVPEGWFGPPPVRPEDSEDALIYQGLSRRLKIVREALGMTIGQFAARYGVDPERWTSVENGDVRPNVSLLKRLCLDHDITLDFLVLGILRRQAPPLMAKIRKDNPELIDEDPTGSSAPVSILSGTAVRLAAMLCAWIAACPHLWVAFS